MRNLMQWIEPLQPDVSKSITMELLAMHAALGGKVGAEVLNLALTDQFSTIVRHTGIDLTDPTHDPESLYHARQCFALFCKNADLDIGCDKEETAWKTFLDGEEACKRTNKRFEHMWDNDWFKDTESGELHRVSGGSFTSGEIVFLTRVRQWLTTILGPCPSFGELKSYFGPGANVGVPKIEACPLNKMRGSLTCSETLYTSGLLEALVDTAPAWFEQRVDGYAINDEGWLYAKMSIELESGRLRFAPKNAETSRAMNIEPVLNGFFQGGVGAYMARRLKLCGVDISDQGQNQALALFGSRHWENAEMQISTLDLKNASGTQSCGLIDFVIEDPGWRYLLSSLRTPRVKYRRIFVDLEQFSTMGNGFTFPLETAIFTAIVFAALKLKPFRARQIRQGVTLPRVAPGVGIYGDDIIVPTMFVADVVRGLEICGYSVNPKKSFISGPFRESCGSDYYKGISVRPYYQRAQMTYESLFSLHNFYVARNLPRFAEYVRSCIPPELRLYGPAGYGDGHLHSNRWKEIQPRSRNELVYALDDKGSLILDSKGDAVRRQIKVDCGGWSGRYFLSYKHAGAELVNPCPGDLATPLYACETRARSGSIGEYESVLYEHSPPRGEPIAAPSLERYKAIVRASGPMALLDQPVKFTPSGRPIWTLPGSTGVEVSKIYTFLRSE